MHRIAVIALALGVAGSVSGQSRLVLQGEVYFDGQMTLHVIDEGNVGQLAYVAYGLAPLDPPVKLGAKGYYYIGTLVDVLAIASIPSGGQLDVPFTIVSHDPAIVGIPVVLQAFVNGKLSNPATLPLDEPYFTQSAGTTITAPSPSVQAFFGDRVTAGDLDDDGSIDVVVGAWSEDLGSADDAGSVYVYWGPDLLTHTHLQPPMPVEFGFFGMEILIGDVDGDNADDLIVAEGSAYPTVSNGPGQLHVYLSDDPFPSTPSFSIVSAGTGIEYSLFGRRATLGDFNDDLDLDIAVGIDFAEVGGESNAGIIEVYWGPNFSSTSTLLSPQPGASDYFGTSLATADINNDGIDDIIEGSGRDDVGGETNIGSVHLFIGPSLNLWQTIDNPLPDGFNSRFGDGVYGVDLNGDGAAEVLTSDDRDRVYIFWSPFHDDYQLLEKPPATIANPFGDTAFGIQLSSGDVNGDGNFDVVIADPFEGSLGGCFPADSGTLFIALAPYFETFHRVVDANPACGDEFSWSIAVRDMDGDAGLELVVGSQTADPGGVSNAGQITIFDLDVGS